MATVTTRSPLAPENYAELPPVGGVSVGGGVAGVRYKGRTDLFVAAMPAGTTVAATLTRSKSPSAPVDWCRKVLPHGRARVIVVNSGNANAFTGKLGIASVERTAQAAAKQFGCREDEVYIASTGVIGEPLPDEKITAALPDIAKKLGSSSAAWADAAAAIMTTDTFPKLATRSVAIDGRQVTINGIAKGSGMIAPDMATMLGFVFTDAAIAAPVLQRLLVRATDRSFNCMTVDGDTSTSDTILLCATGAAGNDRISTPGDPRLRGFARALEAVMIDLARQVVADGEGAEKFITIDVTGAVSARSARRIGLAIANSPLVKTAIAGEDANWGRIVMAVGKAGEPADRDRLAVSIGGVVVAADGQRVDGYDEAPVARHIKTRDIRIAVDLGLGRGKATVWTCDLTKRYIDINAGYRS